MEVLASSQPIPDVMLDEGQRVLKLQKKLNSDHLVILVHGLLGSGDDLTYIRDVLSCRGFEVLVSVANEYFNTLKGVRSATRLLRSEILTMVSNNKELKRISFVGNSLGGIFSRYVIQSLYDEGTQSIAGLRPESFITTASPHLGVWRYTSISAPGYLKRMASYIFGETGKSSSEYFVHQ